MLWLQRMAGNAATASASQILEAADTEANFADAMVYNAQLLCSDMVTLQLWTADTGDDRHERYAKATTGGPTSRAFAVQVAAVQTALFGMLAATGRLDPATQAAAHVRAPRRDDVMWDGTQYVDKPKTPSPTAPAPATSIRQTSTPVSPPRSATPQPSIPSDLRSKFHDPKQFVPSYPSTAERESDVYRSKADPYAVGAASHGTGDLGGKSYGTYQFETYHRGTDGSTITSDGDEKNSTMRRFLASQWGAPYRDSLNATAMASAAFDKAWAAFAAADNKGFGRDQEAFMMHEVGPKLDEFYDLAKATSVARSDTSLNDILIGTINQYGGLAKGLAKAVAAKQTSAGHEFTAREIGRALQDAKLDKVDVHFKSSSERVRVGIRNRIGEERTRFE
jgi:hypothetical protein